MRKQAPPAIMLILVVAIAGATVGFTRSTPPARQGWDYAMYEWRGMREAGLKRLGDQGWELVAVTVEESSSAGHDTWYYFKRPK